MTSGRLSARGILSLSLALAFAGPAFGGATFDGSLGATGALSGNFVVPASFGQQVGGNLFHSFGQFSVNTGESATFAGPANVSNVIARVTGGERSWIDGGLGSSIVGANLFLLNPAGVAFGPNASLDLTGSFFASTADYLKLGENGRFSASAGGQNVLTSEPPSAFGFLSSSPAAIEMQGSFLAVAEGQQIGLVGGDITLDDSTLYAPGGAVQLASVASAGTVGQDSTGAWNNLQGFAVLGDIVVTDNPETPAPEVPDVAPINSIDVSNYNSFGSGGRIGIRGANLTVTTAYLVADTIAFGTGGTIDIDVTNRLRATDGAAMTTGTFMGGDGGVTSLKAASIEFDTGAAVLGDSMWEGGPGGTVNLLANTIRFDAGAYVRSTTDGASRAGNINLSGTNWIKLSGYADSANRTQINTTSTGSGAAGNVTVTAPSLEVSNSAMIYTGSIGRSGQGGGRVSVNVGELNILSGGAIIANNYGDGPGGRLDVNASRSVYIGGGGVFNQEARLSANSFGPGRGGDIYVTTPNLNISTRGAIMAFAFNNGNAGNITLDTTSIVIAGDLAQVVTGTGDRYVASRRGSGNGGTLDARSTGSMSVSGELSGFFSNSFGQGNGGTIRLTADRLDISNEGRVEARAYAAGSGGDIAITANDISMSSQGLVAAGSVGAGATGQLQVVAANSLRMNNGSITTDALSSDGGNMDIRVGKLVFLQDSQITTSVQGGTGTGGNIAIDPEFVVLKNSQITANAYGGNGGNISIVAGHFFADTDSRVQASSQLGIDGTVVIAAPDADVGNNLQLLRQTFADTGALLSSVCAAREADNGSSFVVTGRALLQPSPYDWLMSSHFGTLGAGTAALISSR